MSISNNQKKQIQHKETYLEQIVREALVKKVGGFFDSLIGSDIITRYHLKMDFCMDYSTIGKLREADATVSADTLHKVMYAIAYYLDSHRRKVEAEEEGMTKKMKLNSISELESNYIEIYGYTAQFALDKAKEGMDLRQVVKQ